MHKDILNEKRAKNAVSVSTQTGFYYKILELIAQAARRQYTYTNVKERYSYE